MKSPVCVSDSNRLGFAILMERIMIVTWMKTTGAIVDLLANTPNYAAMLARAVTFAENVETPLLSVQNTNLEEQLIYH